MQKSKKIATKTPTKTATKIATKLPDKPVVTETPKWKGRFSALLDNSDSDDEKPIIEPVVEPVEETVEETVIEPVVEPVVDTFVKQETTQKNIDLMVSKIKTDQLDNITVEIYEPEPMTSSFDPHLQIVSKFGKRSGSLAVTDNFLNSFVKENVNLEDYGNNKLNTSWCLWFHHDPNNWELSGYNKIATFKTIDDYLKIMIHLHMVTSIKLIDLYLFREGIDPIWEAKSNSRGGSWSIKSTSNDGFDLWRKTCDNAVIENLLKTFTDTDKDINGAVNGISITNKMYYTIIKIFVSDKRICNSDLIDKDLISTVSSKIMYQVHMENADYQH